MGLVWVNQSLMYLCIPSKCNLLAALNCTGATCRLTVVRRCHHRRLRRFSPPERRTDRGCRSVKTYVMRSQQSNT